MLKAFDYISERSIAKRMVVVVLRGGVIEPMIRMCKKDEGRGWKGVYIVKDVAGGEFFCEMSVLLPIVNFFAI